MMTLLALIASLGLIIITAIYLLWALGYWWPIKDETALARAVVGTKGITKMPGAVACSMGWSRCCLARLGLDCLTWR